MLFGKAIRNYFRDRRHRKRHAEAKILIVSYPKSGKSLLMGLIGRTLSDKFNLSEYFMHDSLQQTRVAGLPPTIFTYDGCGDPGSTDFRGLDAKKSAYKGKKVIFLFRDPRDVVVSCFRQMGSRKGRYKGTLAEFIRSGYFGIKKVVAFYNIWHKCRSVPDEFLLVRYDDLHRDPRGVLLRVLDYIGLKEVDEELVENVVRYSKVANRKRLEKEGGARKKKLPQSENDAIDLDEFIHDDEDEEEDDGRSRRRSRGGSNGRSGRHGRNPGSAKKPNDKLRKEDYDFMNQAIAEMGCPFLAEAQAEAVAKDWT